MVLVVVDICRVTGNVIIYIVCVPQERHLVQRLEVRIDCRERSTQVEEGDTEKKEETRDFSCQFPEVRRLRARGNGLFCAHGVYVVYVMYGREQRESLSGFFFHRSPGLVFGWIRRCGGAVVGPGWRVADVLCASI